MRRLKQPGNLILGLAALIFSTLFCLSPWGRSLDHLLYDCWFGIRGANPPPKDIVVVAIDEPSFGVIGKQWPWPRSVHSQLIDTLFAGGAKAVILDLVFAELSIPSEDEKLLEVLKHHPNIVLAMAIDQQDSGQFSRTSLITPHPNLHTRDTIMGFTNLPADRDGFIRQALLYQDNLISLAGQVRGFMKASTPLIQEGDRFLINYYGPGNTLETVSYYQALKRTSHLPDTFFKDKLVFIGFSSPTSADLIKKLPDHYPTPFTRWGGTLTPGVEIHATIAANFIANDFITRPNTALILLLSTFLCLFFLAFFFRVRPLAGLAVLCGVLLLLLSLILYLLLTRNFYLSPLYFLVPLTGCYMMSNFTHYWQLWQEERFIRNAFSSYLAPGVVDQLVKEHDKLVLGGKEVEITAFFSDLQGFTTISEQMAPGELVDLLNEFLTEMTDIILDHGGTVDKFEGDAIIAFWGAPLSMRDHAKQACLAAIAMQNRLAELREIWQQKNKPPLWMRIGICSGKAVVGNMGSKKRMDYTMMGDTVNTAARLEGINKIYKTYTLVSASTLSALGENYFARKIDQVRLVGKERPVTVYELLGERQTVSEHIEKATLIYNEALEAYNNREWRRAIDTFKMVLELIADDGPAQVMLARCRHNNRNPPGPDWDGVYKLTIK